MPTGGHPIGRPDAVTERRHVREVPVGVAAAGITPASSPSSTVWRSTVGSMMHRNGSERYGRLRLHGRPRVATVAS